MKIMHVAESFGAGVYSFLVDLCNELAEEHEIIIVYSEREETPKNYKSDFHQNVKFIKFDMGLKSSFLAIPKLVEVLRNEKPDVVHLHSSKAGVIGRIASKMAKYKGKLFYNPHGLAYLRLDLSKMARKLIFLAEKFLTGLGGLVIAVSESEKQEVQKYSKNVISINNGIYLKKLNKELQVVNINNNSSKQLTVGTVGRIAFQKNPQLFNEIAKKFPDIHFLWIGEGNLRHQLTSSNIKITGWMDRKSVLQELSKIDIYIQTSLWEGLPISVLEAMFLKKPLVLNKCVGNVDLVRPGVNGYLCTSKDDFIKSIKAYNSSEVKRNLDGENSYQLLVQEFDKKSSIKKYKEIYIN